MHPGSAGRGLRVDHGSAHIRYLVLHSFIPGADLSSALYSRNLWILGFLMVVLAAQVIISSYGLSLGFRLP